MDFGTFVGSTGPSTLSNSWSLENVLGAEFLRLFADDVTVTSSGGTAPGLFSTNFGAGSMDFLAGAGASMFDATFAGAAVSGLYTETFDITFNDFIANAQNGITGLTAGNGTDSITGADFFLPDDFTAPTLTLTLRALIIVPEPSRAMLLGVGLLAAILPRRRRRQA